MNTGNMQTRGRVGQPALVAFGRMASKGENFLKN